MAHGNEGSCTKPYAGARSRSRHCRYHCDTCPWASPRPKRSAVTSWIPPEPVVIILDPAVWPLYGLGRIDGDGFGGYPTRRADCSSFKLHDRAWDKTKTNKHSFWQYTEWLFMVIWLFVWHLTCLWYPQIKNSSSINFFMDQICLSKNTSGHFIMNYFVRRWAGENLKMRFKFDWTIYQSTYGIYSHLRRYHLSTYLSAYLSTLTGSAQKALEMLDFRRKSLDIWASTVETHLLVAFETCKPCTVLYFDPVSVSLLQQPPQNNTTIYIPFSQQITISPKERNKNKQLVREVKSKQKGGSGWNPFNQILSLEFMIILPGIHLSHEKVSKQKLTPPTT